jgi:hypothetical protein
VTTVRIAAVATLEMITRGEDEVWSFVVEVFGLEFFQRLGGRFPIRIWVRVRHG